ncbi:MFS transporter, partial [Dehalococcoidia bacterium]|nr:MFS transporter [Dehalococcoidia bacterium]
MTAEFGWSYLAFSLAASLRGIERGLAAPLMGLLVDKLGPRKLIFAGAFVAGMGFIMLSRTDSLIMFYGASIVLSLGFSASANVVLTTAVAHWFHRRVSLAMGLLTTGFGMGGLLLPVVIWLINHYDWRTTLFILGIGTWIIIPLLALGIRHKPE